MKPKIIDLMESSTDNYKESESKDTPVEDNSKYLLKDFTWGLYRAVCHRNLWVWNRYELNPIKYWQLEEGRLDHLR